MAKTKVCRGCYQSFSGRKNSKTCSARCRKRLQRAKLSLVQESQLKAYRVPAGRLGVLLLACSLLLAAVASPSGLALSEGYTTKDSQLKIGMAVTFGSGVNQDHPAVQIAKYEDASKVIGIAVGLGEGLLTVAPAGSKVYVAVSSEAHAYISDLNGDVKKGDLLTLSPLQGILMRAKDKSVPTVGTALENLSGSKTQQVEAEKADGSFTNVNVGLMNINVDIKPASTTGSSGALERIGQVVTGHKVNGLRVLTALAIFSTLLVIEGEIIFGTVTSSIIALGRNPLAKAVIGRQAARGMSVAVLILMAGTAAISMLLWL